MVVGGLYLIVIAAWLLMEETPSEPIGNPYLAIMEGLTMVSAVAVVGMMLSPPQLRSPVPARQLWLAGDRADYHLVGPPSIFAVESFAWDTLMGGVNGMSDAAGSGCPG